ncbi:hypothetical protein [Novosphingobium sp. 9]|uniref:hypothetical protein n=1 Tax=Novosphingobium sp. 9 TaxID=2025349 RepID=UPI0021B511AF|nr:hypothetical protein [Novosphingobium sp. 9]
MLRRLFSRKQPEAPAISASTAAAALSRHRADRARAQRRAKVDEMRAAMRMPPIDWKNL